MNLWAAGQCFQRDAVIAYRVWKWTGQQQQAASCLSVKWNSNTNHSVRGELKLSEVQLKEKIGQKAAKTGQKRHDGKHNHRSFCTFCRVCSVFCHLGFCIVSWKHDPPARIWVRDVLIKHSSKAMGNEGTVLPWIKQGACRFRETTGQRWDLQHHQN